jgi:hypothetical protein
MNNFVDVELHIAHVLELLEALEHDCHTLDEWRSLAKPVADCIIKARDDYNALHFKYFIHGFDTK